MNKGRLYVCPIMNTYGPAEDVKHPDLLSSWNSVNKANKKYFSKHFRDAIIDSNGESVKISWFTASWSGFDENPVKRDMKGWFSVHDSLLDNFRKDLEAEKDEIYWIYNHPDKSKIANFWGLDWLHSTHYLNILNRMVLEKNYFPGSLQIPVTDTHSVNFVESYFPYEMSNRSSRSLNWENIEADGKKTKEILKWDRGPDHWRMYNPSFFDHQTPGDMKHKMLRVLDIKTRIIQFPEEEIEKAFKDCLNGYDCIIAGYEHDFRDRSQDVIDIFLKPINKIWKENYQDIEVINSTIHSACLSIEGIKKARPPFFKVIVKDDYLLIESNIELFSQTPYVAIKDLNKKQIYHINPTVNGYKTWSLSREILPEKFQIGLAGFSKDKVQGVNNYFVNKKIVKPVDFYKESTIPFKVRN
jgi:hypothetical protein